MELKDKVILITGGSSGIGRAIALEFARHQTHIFFTYSQNESGAKETASQIESLCSTAQAIKANSTKPEEIESVFEKINQKHQHLDILVNNAGRHIFSKDQLAATYWRDNFDTYLFPAVAYTQQALKYMTQGGKIINTSSIYGNEYVGETGLMPYSAAKAAINSFTRTLAKMVAPAITVNAIAPGYVETPGWGTLTEERKQQLGHDQLIDRFIKPQEIAQAAVMLAQNDAITGEIIIVDGGLSLKTL
jgi:3-oxoacyl-[acyl-carrier protein] reductase